MSLARYETIAGWVNEFGWTKGAELGVSDGATHTYLLEHCPKLTLIGIDIWDLPGIKPGATFSGERCDCEYCEATRMSRRATTVKERENMARAGAMKFGRSTLYKMTTVSAAKKVEDGSLDFVFVDGDHAQQSVSADIKAWRPKIRRGGRLIGHDWNMRSVRDGVSGHYALGEIFAADDHLWYMDL